jgi:hypothetical protein
MSRALRYAKHTLLHSKDLLRGTSLYSLSTEELVERYFKPSLSKLTRIGKFFIPLELQPLIPHLDYTFHAVYVGAKLKELFKSALTNTSFVLGVNFLDMFLGGPLTKQGLNVFSSPLMFLPQYISVVALKSIYNSVLSLTVPWEIALEDDALFRLYKEVLLPKAVKYGSNYEESALYLLPFFHKELKEGPANPSSRLIVALYLSTLLREDLANSEYERD